MLEQKPECVELIVYASCVLHNHLINERGPEYLNAVADQANPAAPNLDWQDANTLLNLPAIGGNSGTKTAKAIRNHLRDYYNAVGAVPWQNDAIQKWVNI